MLHLPMQRQRLVDGVTISDGVRSSWNGHRPTRFAPVPLQLDAEARHQALDGDFSF